MNEPIQCNECQRLIIPENTIWGMCPACYNKYMDKKYKLDQKEQS